MVSGLIGITGQNVQLVVIMVPIIVSKPCQYLHYVNLLEKVSKNNMILLRDDFRIGLVISPNVAVLARYIY
jgi:hypothetical protein